jgi:hypothetical protein
VTGLCDVETANRIVLLGAGRSGYAGLMRLIAHTAGRRTISPDQVAVCPLNGVTLRVVGL